MATKLWVQKWEESERGWGTRPDGYTLHMLREDVVGFLVDMRAKERESYGGATPDEYSRPDGSEPYEWLCEDAALIEKVRASSCGIWGPNGNNYPGTPSPGGWTHIKK